MATHLCVFASCVRRYRVRDIEEVELRASWQTSSFPFVVCLDEPVFAKEASMLKRHCPCCDTLINALQAMTQTARRKANQLEAGPNLYYKLLCMKQVFVLVSPMANPIYLSIYASMHLCQFMYVCRQTGRRADDGQTETHRDTQRHTETDRDRQRQTATDRDRQRQVKTDRDGQRRTDRQRHT